MATEFTMPKLGHLMEEGKVVRWCKQVGERVEEGEILLEVETDKAVLEVESDSSGVLLKVLVEPDQVAIVGVPLALIGEPDESV